jgi:hypothetical protein
MSQLIYLMSNIADQPPNMDTFIPFPEENIQTIGLTENYQPFPFHVSFLERSYIANMHGASANNSVRSSTNLDILWTVNNH